jgi:hypothetical protein
MTKSPKGTADQQLTRAALFYDHAPTDGDVFGGGRREKIAALTELYPHVVNAHNVAEHAAKLGDVEVIFATWGLPAFTEAHFAAMPKLRAVFYAAGNVKAFAAPLVERGVVLVSAWAVNAIPTAELVLSQILLTCRGYFRGVRQYAATKELTRAKDFRRVGAAGETIGLIGMGWIARRLTAHEYRSIDIVDGVEFSVGKQFWRMIEANDAKYSAAADVRLDKDGHVFYRGKAVELGLAVGHFSYLLRWHGWIVAVGSAADPKRSTIKGPICYLFWFSESDLKGSYRQVSAGTMPPLRIYSR